jgi:hypothetical protein
MKQILLPLMLMLMTATANAGVFKCATPNGGFAYSEKPCAKDAKALEFHAVPPTGTETPAAGNSDRLMQKMNDEKRAQKRANEAKEEEAAQNAAIQRKNICAEAKRRLDLYQRGVRVFKTDENGERVYVDDDQRAAIIANAKSAAEANCD